MAPPSATDPISEFKSSEVPHIPEVPILNHKTAACKEVVDALIQAGGCILRNALGPADLEAIEGDTRLSIEKDLEWKGKDNFPTETRRVTGLASKSKIFMEKIVGDTLYQEVCNALLTSTFTCWYGEEKCTSRSNPQLNNTVILSIMPGAAQQPLHRDDMIHHNELKSIKSSQYKVGRDLGIGYFVAGKQTTKLNGATRFIPGSHLWDSELRPREEWCEYAELAPGDAFVMLSSAYHGGSANNSIGEERLVYSCFMTKGFLRQEENQYLANDPEKLKQFYNADMLKIIGYDMSRPSMGWVNYNNPLKVLLGDDAPNCETLL